MESKAWSDQESDDNESKDNDRSSERRPPVLPLGTIYQREGPPAPEPVEREHERTEPEVAQSIVPGMPELSLGAPQEEQSTEHFQFQLPRPESAESTEEDDDEESTEEGAEESRQVLAPLPVEVEEAPEQPQTTLAEDLEQAVRDVPVAEPVAHTEAPEPIEPTPVVVAETPVEDLPPAAPVEATVPYAAVYPQQPEQPDPFTQPVEAPQPVPVFAGAGGGGDQPPGPPLPPEGPAAQPDYPQPEQQRWPDEGLRYAAAPYNAYPNIYTQQSYGSEGITKRDFERHESSSRRKMAAAVITSLALGWYLGHRKVKPLQEQVRTLQKENAQQNEQIGWLEGQQRTAQSTIERQGTQLQQQTYEQQYAAMPNQQPTSAPQPRFETIPGVPMAVNAASGVEATKRPTGQPLPPAAIPRGQENIPRIIGGDGQEIVLQEGQHYERSAGGYGVVLNERNQVVQDAIEYGESFQADRLPERMPTPFGTQDARFKANAAAAAVGGGGGGGGGVPQATLSSGQVPQDHTLSAGPAAGHFPNEEAQHLLDAPKTNPVVSAITSPWLWLGVGILMAAFFAAATI